MSILKIYINFRGLMDLFGPYGTFLNWFGFLCIFFGLLGIVEINFGSFVKIFLIFGFS